MNDAEVQAMCESKVRYPTKKDVRTFLNRAARTRGRHGRAEHLRPYACPICDGWHVTKKV